MFYVIYSGCYHYNNSLWSLSLRVLAGCVRMGDRYESLQIVIASIEFSPSSCCWIVTGLPSLSGPVLRERLFNCSNWGQLNKDLFRSLQFRHSVKVLAFFQVLQTELTPLKHNQPRTHELSSYLVSSFCFLVLGCIRISIRPLSVASEICVRLMYRQLNSYLGH